MATEEEDDEETDEEGEGGGLDCGRVSGEPQPQCDCESAAAQIQVRICAEEAFETLWAFIHFALPPMLRFLHASPHQQDRWFNVLTGIVVIYIRCNTCCLLFTGRKAFH